MSRTNDDLSFFHGFAYIRRQRQLTMFVVTDDDISSVPRSWFPFSFSISEPLKQIEKVSFRLVCILFIHN